MRNQDSVVQPSCGSRQVYTASGDSGPASPPVRQRQRLRRARSVLPPAAAPARGPSPAPFGRPTRRPAAPAGSEIVCACRASPLVERQVTYKVDYEPPSDAMWRSYVYHHVGAMSATGTHGMQRSPVAPAFKAPNEPGGPMAYTAELRLSYPSVSSLPRLLHEISEQRLTEWSCASSSRSVRGSPLSYSMAGRTSSSSPPPSWSYLCSKHGSPWQRQH